MCSDVAKSISNTLHSLAQVSGDVGLSSEAVHSKGIYVTGDIKTRYIELHSLLQQAREDTNSFGQCLKQCHDLLKAVGVTLGDWQNVVRNEKQNATEAQKMVDKLGLGILKQRWKERDNQAMKVYAFLQRAVGFAQMRDKSDMYSFWSSLPEPMKTLFREDMEGVWGCMAALKEVEVALSALYSTISKLLAKVDCAGI